MNPETLALLRTLLIDAGFTVSLREERDGLLGEDEARVVWCAEFPSVAELLDRWIDEQGWFVSFVSARDLSAEKSWELYLVLACEGTPLEDEQPALESARRDASYARKLVVTGVSTVPPSRVERLLAPLKPLAVDATVGPRDAIELIEDAAVAESRTDAIGVLQAFRHNRPLFGVGDEDHGD
jgi:hypothetical protein